MTNPWISDEGGYVGPTSQEEKPLDSVPKTTGRLTGCLGCFTALGVRSAGAVRTSYVAQGVLHEHAYEPRLDR